MPHVIDYAEVLRRMADLGLRSLYHNSGAFGFEPSLIKRTLGWIGPPDPTIRPSAREFTVQVPPPYVENLLRRLIAVRNVIPGPAWLMPMSHWAYELEFGNADWLAPALERIGIDPRPLAGCNQSPAIAFAADEVEAFGTLFSKLLSELANSDFALVFPEGPMLATLHHHRQIWWTTRDAELFEKIREVTFSLT